jgi:hypothetical protein
MDLDKAIQQAIRHVRQQESNYVYCREPDAITGEQLRLLRRDAAGMVEKSRRGA